MTHFASILGINIVIIKIQKCQNKKDGHDGNGAPLEAAPLGGAYSDRTWAVVLLGDCTGGVIGHRNTKYITEDFGKTH